MFPAHLQFGGGEALWRGYASRRDILGGYKAFFAVLAKNETGLLAICSSKDQYNISSLACVIYSMTFLVIFT